MLQTFLSPARVAASVVAVTGLIVALGAWPPTSALIVFLADIIIWPLDGAQDFSSTETRVMCAIAGGVLVGWGVTLWMVAGRFAGTADGELRPIFLSGLYCWFAVDSIGSVLAGAPWNAVFNVAYLVVFWWATGWPLVRASRA